MLTSIYGFASWLAGTAAIAWIVRNLKTVLVAAAVTLTASAISGAVGYFKGYRSAEAGCLTASKDREIAELKRDKSVQQRTSIQLSEALVRQQARVTELEQKVAEHAAKIKPIKGCVVFRTPPRGLR